MIFDELTEWSRYAALGPRLARGLGFLATTDVTALPNGRRDLDGNDLFVSVDQYDTKHRADGVWEAHRRYIDIQCLASGREQLGCAAVSAVEFGAYDVERDLLLATAAGTDTGQGDFVTLVPGRFVVLFPHDAHMPGVAVNGQPERVKKIVVKVRVDD